jgi:hypothetical protein
VTQTLIQQRREKILAYNSQTCLEPLIFMDRKGGILEIAKEDLKFNKSGTPNRRRLVLSILEMCRNYGSTNQVTNKFETDAGRNRSAIDIWRHAKALYPNIDVFRIMETIWQLCEEGEVFGQYCHRVMRAVFRTWNHDGKDTDMHFDCHEYDIVFNTWELLHETPPSKEKKK